MDQRPQYKMQRFKIWYIWFNWSFFQYTKFWSNWYMHTCATAVFVHARPLKLLRSSIIKWLSKQNKNQISPIYISQKRLNKIWACMYSLQPFCSQKIFHNKNEKIKKTSNQMALKITKNVADRFGGWRPPLGTQRVLKLSEGARKNF